MGFLPFVKSVTETIAIRNHSDCLYTFCSSGVERVKCYTASGLHRNLNGFGWVAILLYPSLQHPLYPVAGIDGTANHPIQQHHHSVNTV